MCHCYAKGDLTIEINCKVYLKEDKQSSLLAWSVLALNSAFNTQINTYFRRCSRCKKKMSFTHNSPLLLKPINTKPKVLKL